MPSYFRRRSPLYPAITLSVVLMILNITLMVCWIVLLAQLNFWSALTVGTVVFALMLVGISLYLALTVKEIRLNQRQANFVDSVTHELKSPIATLQLYLETLQMRALEEPQRKEFFVVMERELQRLDHLISQLLEVGRLDAIGEQTEAEDIPLEPLLLHCATTASAHHKVARSEVFKFEIQPAVVHTRRLILEMIFNNLLDNAIKYAGEKPEVEVQVSVRERGRVAIRIADNGSGVEADIRRKIFQRFYRGGKELERRQKGTGLGLYIVRTLVRKLKGRINVHSRVGQPGSIFEVELPGKAETCAS